MPHCPTGPQLNWHLQWQAAEGQTFVPIAGLAERIRDRLVSAHERRGRVLIDFTILPTEIHLISGIFNGDSPGAIAGAIGNFVSRWVREARRSRSPVMGGPFQSCRLRSDDEVRQEIRMLAWRPVVLGLCRGPTFHPHGALRVALGRRHRQGFDTRPMLRFFGPETTAARLALTAFVLDRPSSLEWQAWELARGLARAPSHGGPQPSGFREVKTHEAAALLAMAGEGGVEGALGLLGQWVSLKLGAPGGFDLVKDRSGPAAQARAVIARIASRHLLCSSAFVAGCFKRGKSTLCEQVAASRMREVDNKLVATPMKTILTEMRPQPGRKVRAGR